MIFLFYIIETNYFEVIIKTTDNIRNYQEKEREAHAYIILHAIYKPFEPLATDSKLRIPVIVFDIITLNICFDCNKSIERKKEN